MAAPKGTFDTSALNLGWFGADAQDKGWFDEDFLDSSSSAPATRPLAFLTAGIAFAVSLSHAAPEQIRPARHDLTPFRVASAQSGGHAVQQHNRTLLLRSEVAPPNVNHNSHLFFGRVTTQQAAQPIWLWKDPVLHHAGEGNEDRGKTKDSLFEYRQFSPVAPVSVNPYWIWQAPRVTLDIERVRPVSHDALFSFRAFTRIADGHAIQQHSQVRITQSGDPQRGQDHSSRMFFGRGEVTPPPAIQSFFLWSAKGRVEETQELIYPADHPQRYATEQPSSVGQPWHLWQPIRHHEHIPEGIFAQKHDLTPFRLSPVTPPEMVGHVIQNHERTIFDVEQRHQKPYDHHSRLFYGRPQTEITVSQPYWLWNGRAVAGDENDVGYASSHSLHSYRSPPAIQGQPWVIFQQKVSVAIPQQEFSPKPHSLFDYRGIYVQVEPGQPWHLWKPVIGEPTPEEWMHREFHDASLYPFRPHPAIPPIIVIDDVNGGGRIRHLPRQYRVEDEKEKINRRARQLEQKHETPVSRGTNNKKTNEFKELSKNRVDVSAALYRVRGELEDLRLEIARREAEADVRAYKALLLLRQQEQYATLKEQLLLQEMEAIDVAMIAMYIALL